MSTEIRIYFECLEQAEHFVHPIIQTALNNIGNKIKVKLVRMKKHFSAYSSRLAPILFWKVPDILLTIVLSDVEYPLLLVEFSNAVFTEDHELQRFDGLVAAADCNCLYAKISPSTKESVSDHGGNIDYDFAGPFSLIKKKFNRVFFHFDWVCDSSGLVEVDSDYVSCPQKILAFEHLIENLLRAVLSNGATSNWIDELTKILHSDNFFLKWIRRLDAFQPPDVSDLDTSRTKWIAKDPYLRKGVLELKLNRFGHAMDPERGMLAYYGIMGKPIVSKMMFSLDNDAWYKSTSKEAEIRAHLRKSRLVAAYDYLYCFALGAGISTKPEFKKIVEGFRKADKTHIEVDISVFVNKYYLNLNKPIRTILKYSELFVIEDSEGHRRVTLKWNPITESGVFSSFPDVTPISDRISLGEDDVTYLTVHNVMIPNGYSILAASYPGSQADRVILIAPGTGRSQRRKYVDVIAHLPPRIITLQENKGVYSSSSIQTDIRQVTKFKKDKKHKHALEVFCLRMLGENKNTETKVGVGFWASKSFDISQVKQLDLDELDYFMYISKDMQTWYIWSSSSTELFEKKKGQVTLPNYFEIIS